MSNDCYKLELQPLPYGYDALEPYINTQTMQIHHDRLLKAYVDRTNEILADCPRLQGMPLGQILCNLGTVPANIRTSVTNFGGGVWNHNFFFLSLRPGENTNLPVGALETAIENKFGSFEKFKALFTEHAMAVFGSGWLWLVKDHRNNLSVMKTANQDSPISFGYTPLITIDIWEHAYFLQYLNVRKDYIKNWFHVINWERANEIYASCK